MNSLRFQFGVVRGISKSIRGTLVFMSNHLSSTNVESVRILYFGRVDDSDYIFPPILQPLL